MTLQLLCKIHTLVDCESTRNISNNKGIPVVAVVCLCSTNTSAFMHFRGHLCLRALTQFSWLYACLFSSPFFDGVALTYFDDLAEICSCCIGLGEILQLQWPILVLHSVKIFCWVGANNNLSKILIGRNCTRHCRSGMSFSAQKMTQIGNKLHIIEIKICFTGKWILKKL